jgi:hypothetical protein
MILNYENKFSFAFLNTKMVFSHENKRQSMKIYLN